MLPARAGSSRGDLGHFRILRSKVTKTHPKKEYPYLKQVPKWIRQIKSGEQITIYGDGSQTMDMIYGSDIGRANIAAMDKSQLAFQVWIKTTDTTGYILDAGFRVYTGKYGVYLTSGRIRTRAGSTDWTAAVGTEINDDVWHHILITYDKTLDSDNTWKCDKCNQYVQPGKKLNFWELSPSQYFFHHRGSND